jgi:hypothetical protein
MKRFFLLGLISMVFVSCSKDEVTPESISSVKEEIKINDFLSQEMMENKIDEIISLIEQKEKVVLENFTSRNNSKIVLLGKLNTSEQVSRQNNAILKDLKLYHKEKLNTIYELRKELNFTSIQSIADEINSLILVDPTKAKKLSDTYQKFLVKNNMEIETIFDNRSANVINNNGEVLINGEKLNFNKANSTNQTGRYVKDETMTSGIAVYSGEYFVYYVAGRQLHKNTFGVRFFKYFAELKSYMATPNGVVACPSTFVVDSGSIAGFVQTGSQPFSDYSFTYAYISGTGTSVRNTGGNKNTPYKPAGGKIVGKFSTTIGGVYQEMSCDIKYTEK